MRFLNFPHSRSCPELVSSQRRLSSSLVGRDRPVIILQRHPTFSGRYRSGVKNESPKSTSVIQTGPVYVRKKSLEGQSIILSGERRSSRCYQLWLRKPRSPSSTYGGEGPADPCNYHTVA
ncbi:hypothetical protein J6590_098103 [Homalodisca vitripennis]|nr:hypothetical protein J6590_098103 [Homalodisca vitripennis]